MHQSRNRNMIYTKTKSNSHLTCTANSNFVKPINPYNHFQFQIPHSNKCREATLYKIPVNPSQALPFWFLSFSLGFNVQVSCLLESWSSICNPSPSAPIISREEKYRTENKCPRADDHPHIVGLPSLGIIGSYHGEPGRGK